MPFSKTPTCSEGRWTNIFTGLIKPAVESASPGYVCRRSTATTGNLIKGIVENLYQASVVMADLTDQRPNVFYELGARHALKSPTIMIAQRLSDIPSDLQGYACVKYDPETDSGQQAFTVRIQEILQTLATDVDRSDNPVSDFLRARSAVILDFEHDQNVRKLRALCAELHVIETLLDNTGIEPDSNGRYWSPPFSCPALDHYLATQYIAVESFSNEVMKLRTFLAAMGGNRFLPRSFDSAKALAQVLRRNAAKILEAYSTGSSLNNLELEPMPPAVKASEPERTES